MFEIKLIGKEGYIKLYPKKETIEIRNSNFYAKGKVKLDKSTLIDMKQELKKCVDCEYDLFSKSIIVSKNKLLGIELRCDGAQETVLLIGEYKEKEGDVFEFEFIVEKKEIENTIFDIEKIIQS